VQIYWPSTTNALHWNAPSWSVSCELFFYALFPLLLLPMMRFFVNIRRLVIAAAAIYAIEVGIYFATAALLERQIERYGSFLGFVDTPKALTNLVPLVPVIRIAEFAIGMCLGLIVARGGLGWLKVSRLRRDATLALTILGIYLLERTNLSPLGEAIEGTKYFLLFVPLFSVLMATLVSGTNIFTSMLEHRLVVLLGEASYSLYLLHYPMGMLLLKRKTPIEYVLACVAVVLLSVLTFAFLERPLTVYLQGRVRQRAKHGERPAELVK
jgi:peptidoglycan/LPS O-acetylase OafA/YrhL